MEVFGDIRYPAMAKKLLAQVRGQAISMDGFLKECAYWALVCGFDELAPFSYPSCPTSAAMNEYETLPPDRKLKVAPEFFLKNPEINEYYNQRSFVFRRNKAALEWLINLSRYIPAGDYPSQEKIRQRIADFRAFDDDPNIQKLADTFNAVEA